MQIKRRPLLVLGALGATSLARGAEKIITEYQRGDPMLEREFVSFDAQRTQSNVGATKADYLPKLKDHGNALLQEAALCVGFSRDRNKGEISDMLALFDLKFADGNGKPYAYCAAGLSYVAARAYAKSKNPNPTFADIVQALGDVHHYHFYPTPGVANMVQISKIQNRWIDLKEVLDGKRSVKPGALIAYKWNRTDHHIGLVKTIRSGKCETIEFNTSPEGSGGSNTNGGRVAERVRPLNQTVLGFINVDRTVF